MDASIIKRARSKAPARVLFFSLISVCIGTTLALLMAEYVVRIFAPQSLVSDIVIADRDIDYRLKPNATGHMRSPEYSALIRINSLGFRGGEVPLAKGPGVRRILFLGDSFTFGHGLGEKETLPYVVDEELARRHPGRYEVINGGVYGYSTANEVEFFLKFGLPIKPDIVVILVMIHDMLDNSIFYQLTSNGKLIRKPTVSQSNQSRRVTRHIPGSGWFRENSHLFKFVGLRILPVLKSGIARDVAAGAAHNSKFKLNVDETSEEFYREKGGAFEVTTALLSELALRATEHGARAVLLTLGGAEEIVDGEISPKRMLPHRRLANAALAVGFAEAVSLSPILVTYEDPKYLFFPRDKHWTAVATRFVAPAVADVILKAAK